MQFRSQIRSLFRNLLRRQQVESQLDDEVRAYIEMAAEEKVAAGISPEKARRAALAEFGGAEQVKQAVREQRMGAGIEVLGQDLRYALRLLRRSPGFTLVAVITLGLGIGATTAIFSAIYSLLLRPLPYRDPSKLVSIFNYWPKIHLNTFISPDFIAARQQTKSFEQLAAFVCSDANLSGGGEPVRVTVGSVSANFFPTLGITPQIGRNFSKEEDKAGGPDVVLLSDRLWRRRFNANPKVVGATIILNGGLKTIIGVLPSRFFFPDIQVEPDVFAPLDLDSVSSFSGDLRFSILNVIGRLRSGVSMQQADTEMHAFFLARKQHSYPVDLVDATKGQQTFVEPLQRHLTGEDRKPLFLLLAAVGCVLLIVCANIANLELARAESRQHETALRGALGASRMRLVRLFFIESVLLSLLAAATGLLIAVAATSLVRHAQTLEGTQIPDYLRTAQLLRLPFGKWGAGIQMDGWVLAFTVVIALGTTLIFGLAPALGGTRTDLAHVLRASALRITAGHEQRWLRHSLLVAEVGLAVVLLTFASMLIRSFVTVLHYDSGFDARNTLTGTTLLSSSRYAATKDIQSFVNQLLPRLEALPGVTEVAVTSLLPLQPYNLRCPVTFDGLAAPPVGMRPTVAVISVTPDYFRAVGTPLFRGRPFDATDRKTSSPVAIVNRAFANRYFAGDALGKRFATAAQDYETLTVVGIAADIRHDGLEGAPEPEVFLPMAQFPQSTINIVLRTSADPGLLANAMREAVTSVDRGQPLFDIQTMDQRVSNALARRRLIMLLLACFAGLAVVLSGVGVYGVFSYFVMRRSREMGIRVALGSTRRGVLRLVVGQAARLIVLGGVLGVAVALVLSRFITSLLAGITPNDGVSFIFSWMVITLVALFSSAIPALHAVRTDCVSVLHSE